MSDLNTPEEVLAWADKAARADYERHKTIHTDEQTGEIWQWDKNPYTTQGARHEWEQGFKDLPLNSFEPENLYHFATAYQRGRAMARLLKALKEA